MKTYQFRITQPATAYYEAKVEIEAKNEADALRKLNSLTQEELEDKSFGWTAQLDNMTATGAIEIHECLK